MDIFVKLYNVITQEEVFVNKHKIEYKTFKNVLGTYQIAKITKMEVD